MKKKFGSLFLACLMATVFTMGVFAAGAAKEIKAILRQDATFSIEGKAKTYKDKDGKALYPIEYNGRVYLPAEAVQGITGKTVKWDSKAAKLDITTKKETDSSKPSTTVKNRVSPVMIEEVPISIEIVDKYSTGDYWLQATYKNKSNYAITGYSVTVLLKDKNTKTYLSVYDTVRAGETSSIFDTTGPDSGSKSDIEILKYSITAVINGKNTYIDYDCKLKRYEQW